MKVLMINGSPKDNGNTARALAEMCGVFEKEGVEIEYFHTLSIEYRKSFQPLPPPMQTLKNFICANLNRELSSEQLAGVIGVSQATLRRQVRRCFSCSPLELCTSLRLEHAAMLLRTTGRAVKDIALDCGFNSPLYFGTVFKSVYGMTPGRYRNSGPTDDPPFRFVQE